MPIKTGDLVASAPGDIPTMISDGKRLRILWQESHGNGDSNSHLVERCRNTVKGHPTWKLFCGFVPNPIVREENEPPYYVYLDDRACYAIWISMRYEKHELRTLWPFDFDHLGKIKAARPNRGRPAYLDDSCTEYAQGLLRDKKKVYVFSGCPDYVHHMPAGVGMTIIDGSDDLPIPNGLPLITEIPETTSVPPLPHPEPKLGYGRILFEPSAPRRYIAGPSDGNLMPLGMAHKAMQGSPYFDNPTAMYRSRPRPRDGDLAAAIGIVTRRKAAAVQEEDGEGTGKKRRPDYEVAAFESSSKAKRVKTEVEPEDD